jgi:hypothetical protein
VELKSGASHGQRAESYEKETQGQHCSQAEDWRAEEITQEKIPNVIACHTTTEPGK